MSYRFLLAAACCCLLLVSGAWGDSLHDILMEGEDWQLVAEGYQFTEAPAADGEGNVYFADVPDNKIYRVDAATGEITTFVKNSFRTSGLMMGPGGVFYGCQQGKERIVKFDAQGKATGVVDGVSCNDLVVTSGGGVYFTDPRNHSVWYVSPAGEKRQVAEGIAFPNGIITTPDEGTLIVADTRSPHAWYFRIERDGSLSLKQPFATLRVPDHTRGQSGADGMTVDSEGRIYVATYAGVQVLDDQGRVIGVIARPQQAFLSNVVFGGRKMNVLYATSTDKVYKRKLRSRGHTKSQRRTVVEK